MFTRQVKPHPDEQTSNKRLKNSTGTRGGVYTPEDDKNTRDFDGGNIAPANNVESLKRGIINTSEAKPKSLYTIVLVGETGVGKSSVVEFIANVLFGKDIDNYDFEILDHTNEQGGSGNQTQTTIARLYEFTSKNGIVVLDTPGLIDTRDHQHDELYKKSIATDIQKHVDAITAVLVLANGTVTRGTGGLHTVLSTLSTVFPKALSNSVAFMFTNVASPLSWNFSPDNIPDVLKGARHFRIDNPVALQKKYLKLQDQPSMKNSKTKMREEVNAGEEDALETLVDLFDWLDGLEQRPTREVFSL